VTLLVWTFPRFTCIYCVSLGQEWTGPLACDVIRASR